MTEPFTAFGHFVLALFRRKPVVAPPHVEPAGPDRAGDRNIDNAMAALKRELELLIDRDLKPRRRPAGRWRRPSKRGAR